ncbi:hypothetical protein AMR42_17325 [Limnothrix sp. PR1529]|nr:hypothetical protein AMR42_17325 [Limnothrix sp. PR1529]
MPKKISPKAAKPASLSAPPIVTCTRPMVSTKAAIGSRRYRCCNSRGQRLPIGLVLSGFDPKGDPQTMANS